jgi:hypothetical protein
MTGDKTEARIAKLEAELAELKRANKSTTPLDFKGGAGGPTTTELAMSRLGMSPEVLADHVRAVGGVVVREIVGDGGAAATLKPLSQPSTPRVADQNTSGWREARPLEAPPGISLIDRLVEVQTARDTAELIQKEAQRLAKK